MVNSRPSDWISDSKGNTIHKTAVLERVRLGKGNHIGPYCVLVDCRLGDNNQLFPFVSIGCPPEMKSRVDSEFEVRIGNNNRFREFCTVHAGVSQPTIIGDDNEFFTKSHAAHDVEVGSRNIICGGTFLGGYVRLFDDVNVGGGSLVHQHVWIGSMAMIGQGAIITRHVMPGTKIAARESKVVGLNDFMLQNESIEKELRDIEKLREYFMKELENEQQRDPRKNRQIHGGDEEALENASSEPSDTNQGNIIDRQI